MSTTHLGIPYPPHTVLGELRTAELVVVSSLRLWIHDYCGCTCGYPDWRDGLTGAGINAAGAKGFDTVWRIVARTARRALDIRPMFCAGLGEDEGQFLRLLALLQNDKNAAAESILGDWCPPTAARIALPPAMAFASALGTRRLWLPLTSPVESTSSLGPISLPALRESRVH